MMLRLLLHAALLGSVAAVSSSHPVTLVGGPAGKPCAAGAKVCCHYNNSIFHSHLHIPPLGPAPFRLDQHYTLNVIDDMAITITSANGTFADTVITVDLPVDDCDRVNCTACAACGFPCGGNKADEACAKSCPGACVEKIWGQDLTATFSTDPSGRSNARWVMIMVNAANMDCPSRCWP